MIKKIVLFFSILMFFSPVQAAEFVQLKQTQASLISRQASIQPGQPVELALLLQHIPHWYSYWENPGEAGIPTTLTWTLPEGFEAGDIRWPVPKKKHEGPLAVYGLKGDILLPVTIATPESLDDSTPITIKLEASWLVCREICIPESAELDLTLPVSENEPALTIHALRFEEHDAAQPTKVATQGVYVINSEDKLVLSMPRDELRVADVVKAEFYPREQGILIDSAPQELVMGDEDLVLLTKPAQHMLTNGVSGMLLVEDHEGQKTFEVSYTHTVKNTDPIPTTSATTPTGSGGSSNLLLLMAAAMLGGMILNLMPCVLPVLSLKALAISKKAGQEHAHVAKLGIAYTTGILVSFAVIAGLLIGLQQAGEAVGWGYQMQSPAFVGFLIFLLFLVGLNLSGLFDLPVLFGNVGSEVANESSPRGSFATGVLATMVATPCTAPFMASAIGVALTLPAWQAMLIFESLGLGLALPFLLVSIFPKLLRFLPKPGAWMETFKQFLAFPMYASVIWLLWVLTLQTGAGGMVVALTGMLGIIAVIWMKRLYADRTRFYHGLVVVLLAVILALTLPTLNRMEADGMMDVVPEEHAVQTIPYSKEKLDELRNNGTPVFVDATAAWCITCQVNARTAIHRERTMAAFNEQGVVLMIADWTRQNPEISEFLKSFGYQGVPLYVFYPAAGEPKVLPQILTEDIIINTITP